jgi:ureidoglycolate hydrolase
LAARPFSRSPTGHGLPLWLPMMTAGRANRAHFGCPAPCGLQYGRNIWHHPLIAVGEPSQFLVMDREGEGDNLEEIGYPAPYVITEP